MKPLLRLPEPGSPIEAARDQQGAIKAQPGTGNVPLELEHKYYLILLLFHISVSIIIICLVTYRTLTFSEHHISTLIQYLLAAETRAMALAGMHALCCRDVPQLRGAILHRRQGQVRVLFRHSASTHEVCPIQMPFRRCRYLHYIARYLLSLT